MSTYALVTGLPRSRTAWISCLLTAVGCEVSHEFRPKFKDVRELEPWLLEGTPAKPHVYVDGAVWAYPQYKLDVIRIFTDHPVLAIKRDPTEVERSWSNWTADNFSNPTIEYAVDMLEGMLEELPHHVIAYEQMDDFHIMQYVVRYLSGKVLPKHVFDLFDTMKIELHRQKVWRRINEISTGAGEHG